MRRHGRECALQILFQLDTQKLLGGGNAEISAAIEGFWQNFDPVSDQEREFSEGLVAGVLDHLPALEQELSRVSRNWKLERMAVVDRCVLRLAAYEILHRDDTPHKVAINEAVEIAKRFSGSDSSAFINGILDNLAVGPASPT